MAIKFLLFYACPILSICAFLEYYSVPIIIAKFAKNVLPILGWARKNFFEFLKKFMGPIRAHVNEHCSIVALT